MGTASCALHRHSLISYGMTVILTCIVLQGCEKRQEHKWLYYDLDKKNGLVYQGYTITREHEERYNTDASSPPLSAVPPLVVAGDPPKDKHTAQRNKPTVDEDDQLHFVVSGSNLLPDLSCQFVETSYKQAYDSKVVPQYKQPPTPLINAEDRLRLAQQEYQHQLEVTEQAHRKTVEMQNKAIEARERASRAPSNRRQDVQAEANDLSRLAREANIDYSRNLAKLLITATELGKAQAELQSLGESVPRNLVCDLDVREKGGTKIDYVLANKKAKVADSAESEVLLKDSILVHELYRFRILAGPVYSTVTRHNKNYQLSPDNTGQTVITATAAQDSPANFALFLKAYHTKRDVLDPPALFSKRWYETFNPIIGINLFDKPLQNFYAGISFEPWGGFDIVGGAHWAKTTQLVDGFSQGQVVSPSLTGFTKQVFTNGWFVGVTADVGIVTTWLKNAGSEVLGAFKSNP